MGALISQLQFHIFTEAFPTTWTTLCPVVLALAGEDPQENVTAS